MRDGVTAGQTIARGKISWVGIFLGRVRALQLEDLQILGPDNGRRQVPWSMQTGRWRGKPHCRVPGRASPGAGDSLLPFAVSKPRRATPRGAGKPAGAGHRALRRDGGGVGRDCLPHGAGEEDLAVMAGQLCQGSALPLHPLPQGLPCQQGQEQACRWGEQRGGWREASGGESHVHLTASLRVINCWATCLSCEGFWRQPPHPHFHPIAHSDCPPLPPARHRRLPACPPAPAPPLRPQRQSSGTPGVLSLQVSCALWHRQAFSDPQVCVPAA